jgi:hypothetical protein
MKKLAFAVLVVAVAASPAMAAKKAKKAAPAQPTVAELNDPGFRFVRDSLPVYYPSIVKAGMYPVGNKSK